MKARTTAKIARPLARTRQTVPHLSPIEASEQPQSARPFDYSVQQMSGASAKQSLRHIPILAPDNVTAQGETATAPTLVLAAERAVDVEHTTNRPNASNLSLADITITRNAQESAHRDATSGPGIQRLSSQKSIIQRKPDESARSKQNNTGLPDHLKTGIESLSGLSLDDVQVHYNSSKPAQMDALAYTQGGNIYMGPRQEKHLAHEAWHVVQQKLGLVQPVPGTQGVGITNDQSLERDADVMGAKALQTPPSRLMHSANALPTSLHSGIAPIQAMRIRRANGAEEEVSDDYELKDGESHVTPNQPSEVIAPATIKRSLDTDSGGAKKKVKSYENSLVNDYGGDSDSDSEKKVTLSTNPVVTQQSSTQLPTSQLLPINPPAPASTGKSNEYFRSFLSVSRSSINPLQQDSTRAPTSLLPPISQPAPASTGKGNDYFRNLANQQRSSIDQLRAQLNQLHSSNQGINATMQAIRDAAQRAPTAEDLLDIIQLVGGNSSHGRGFKGLQARFGDDRYVSKDSGHGYIEQQTLILYQQLVALYRQRYKKVVPGSQEIIDEAKKRDFDKDPPRGSGGGRGAATTAPRGRLNLNK